MPVEVYSIDRLPHVSKEILHSALIIAIAEVYRPNSGHYSFSIYGSTPKGFIIKVNKDYSPYKFFPIK